jgi:hypothetical protein
LEVCQTFVLHQEWFYGIMQLWDEPLNNLLMGLLL